MPEKTADVVVPCFNGEGLLAQTLDAALAQTYRPLRVLVVDDGSTDGTRQVVESYRGRVDYVHKENGGQASARNLGIARTSGDFVCLLDADDLITPDMISNLVLRLESRPEADVAYGQQHVIFGDDRAHPCTENWRPDVAWDSYIEPLSLFCAIHSSATVLRRRAFERYGLFPESRSLQGCEDWHFWLQAALQGAAIERVPAVFCLYRHHATSSSSGDRKILGRESNLMNAAVRLFERHGVRSERHWAILSVGIASLSARWLSRGEYSRFSELLALSARVAPETFRRRHLEPLPMLARRADAGLLQLRLCRALLDVGSPALAAAIFLRCSDLGRVQKRAAPAGLAECVETVAQAMDGLIEDELSRARDPQSRSYLSHVAVGLGRLDRAAGRPAQARVRFEEAVSLDFNNVRAKLELAFSSVRGGRLLSGALGVGLRWLLWVHGRVKRRLGRLPARLRTFVLMRLGANSHGAPSKSSSGGTSSAFGRR